MKYTNTVTARRYIYVKPIVNSLSYSKYVNDGKNNDNVNLRYHNYNAI